MSNLLREISTQLNDIYYKTLYGEFPSSDFDKCLEKCKEHNIVICFVNSDKKSIILKGVVEWEFFKTNNPSKFYIDSYGMLHQIPNNNTVIQSYKSIGYKPIEVAWKRYETYCPQWRYEFETPIPHETFEIQNGDCLGIVFKLPTY